MAKEVFFSYSWKDRPIAMRIYADLVRNDLNIWRDLFSVEPGKKFEDEIRTATNRCDGVILIDSAHSRLSAYVHDEWRVLNQSEDWKAGRKKLAICLVGDEAGTRRAPQLFAGHNKHRFIDFSGGGTIYDNERKYLLAITGLCETFGVPYRSAYPDTSEKDFEDELSKCTITDTDRTILIKEYELIQLRISKGFPYTIQRLDLFAKECYNLKLACPSPTLQLSVELLKTNEFVQAKNVLNIYTRIYPDDSRGWRALASALYEMEEFEQALEAYNKAILLCLHIKYGRKRKEGIRFDNKILADYLLVLKVNRANALFELGYHQKAIHAYERTLSDKSLLEKILPEHYLRLIYAFHNPNNAAKQYTWIERALSRHSGDQELVLAKARWLRKHYSEQVALCYYDYLVSKDIQSVSFYSEYLKILRTSKCVSESGKASLFNKAYDKAIQLNPVTPSELYHYGHVLYLNGNIEKAREYYIKSNYKELPCYDKL